MIFNKLNIIYLSATGNTQKIASEISQSIAIKEKRMINLLNHANEMIVIPEKIGRASCRERVLRLV